MVPSYTTIGSIWKGGEVVLVNQTELAECLGVTPRRVRDMIQEGFFQFKDGRKYNLAPCIKEYIAYKLKPANSDGEVDLDKEKAEHERAKKEISQLKLRKMKGEVHEAVYVELYWNEMLLNFANKLETIPSKIAVQVVGETDVQRIIKLLDDSIEEALNELSKYDPTKIESSTDDYSEDDEETEGADDG